jgi:hypothetical protein
MRSRQLLLPDHHAWTRSEARPSANDLYSALFERARVDVIQACHIGVAALS